MSNTNTSRPTTEEIFKTNTSRPTTKESFGGFTFQTGATSTTRDFGEGLRSSDPADIERSTNSLFANALPSDKVIKLGSTGAYIADRQSSFSFRQLRNRSIFPPGKTPDSPFWHQATKKVAPTPPTMVQTTSDNRPKVYMAGGWFNPDQKALYTRVKDMLERAFCTYYSPMDAEQPEGKCLNDEWMTIYNRNLAEIKKAQIVVACVTEMADTGTMWELGYATALGMPIILITSDEVVKVNLMPLSSAALVYKLGKTSIDDLHSAFRGLLQKLSVDVE